MTPRYEITLANVILDIEYLVTWKQAPRELLEAAYKARRDLNPGEVHTTQDTLARRAFPWLTSAAIVVLGWSIPLIYILF